MDFKIARDVTRARVRRSAAIGTGRSRLNEAARIAWALSLPRLHAVVENERIRLGLPVTPEFGALPVTSYAARRLPGRDRPDDRAARGGHRDPHATSRKRPGADGPRAPMGSGMGRSSDGAAPAPGVVAGTASVGRLPRRRRTQRRGEGHARDHRAQCAQLGLVRYLLDGGPHVVATIAQSHSGSSRPNSSSSEWPEVPADFLERFVNAKAVQRI